MPDLKIMDLVKDIERGDIKIPQFQRDFVWRKNKAAKLLDSIIRGYPIGSFIFWLTREPLRSVRNLGGVTLPDPRPGYQTQYILDGQQRVTSIFASINGLVVHHSDSMEDFSDIFINLSGNDGDDICVTYMPPGEDGRYIKLKILLAGTITELNEYDTIYHSKIIEYRRSIETYTVPAVTISDLSMNIAADIFTRINVGGKPLTIFEIMVAKTYNVDPEFDLAKKYDELDNKLSRVGFKGLSDAVLLRCISVILIGECKSSHIYNLPKNDFIAVFPHVIECIDRAIDFFRSVYKIPVLGLLPYEDLIVLFSYFFHLHKNRPDQAIAEWLEDIFWRISLTGRYSSGTETKIAQDIKYIQNIVSYETPKYNYSPINAIQPNYLKQHGEFKIANSYIKALLCLLIQQEPKSFFDNATIRFGPDILHKDNRNNFHHFFPKAYMVKHQPENKNDVNHIANITLIEEHLNQKIIRDKPPSEYMDIFRNNPGLAQAMRSHLIDIDNDGIWNDNYDLFYEQRVSKICELLSYKIKHLEIDETPPIPVIAGNYLFITVKRKGILAKGHKIGRSFRVLKNSLASIDISQSLSRFDKDLRQSLINRNILVDNNGLYEFAQDYDFDSPSAAASIICGSSRSGNATWADVSGRKLKDL